jgi:hypothetical protein
MLTQYIYLALPLRAPNEQAVQQHYKGASSSTLNVIVRMCLPPIDNMPTSNKTDIFGDISLTRDRDIYSYQ